MMVCRFISLAGALALLVTSLAAEEKAISYDVRGIIQALRPESKEMIIRHEAIPGYMDAMVMPFSVRDAQLFQQVAVGDSVTFKLKVTSKEDWMEELKVTAPGKQAASSLPKADSVVRPGQTLSFTGIKLVDHNGQAFDLGETRGKTLALTFFFTRCPMPQMCPLLSSNFAAVQKHLMNQGRKDVSLLSITLDPKHDQPGALLLYASHYKVDSQYWRLATGDITQLSVLCGVNFWDEQGLINHSLLTLVISPAGKVIQVYRDTRWSPKELIKALESAIE